MRHRRIGWNSVQLTAAALLLAAAVALGALPPSGTARAGVHVHTADCYEGKLHICSGSTEDGGGCYADSPSACPNGCVLHTCRGNSWNGGSCYDSGSYSTCGSCWGSGTVTCSTCNGSGSRACTGSFRLVSSYEEDCGWCAGTDHEHKEGVANERYSCSTCGASYEYRPAATCPYTGNYTNGCNNPDCYANHTQPCSYTYPEGNSHSSIGCPTTEQCGSCGGSGEVRTYQKNCGKVSGKYYVGDSLCPYCGGDNRYYAKTCGKASGECYDASGNKCGPVCSMVVTGLAATEASQTLNAGETPVFTAEATFLDGHTETVVCDVSGYSGTLYDTMQDVTLSYGTYKGTAKTKGKTSVSISVYINGYFRLSLTSENTAKGTVRFTGGTVEAGTAGTDAASVTAKVLAGTRAALTATPKAGFTFAGWYWGLTKVSGSATYQMTMPAHDYALTAKFLGKEVTVSFDSRGGEACAPIKANYLGTYGRLPVPVRDGYVFLGWAYGGKQITGTSPVSVASDHTLTAQWAERGPDYITTGYGSYYGVNDWAKSRGYVTAGNPYGALPLRVPAMFAQPAETKTGYTFLDWYLDETDGSLSSVRGESKVVNSTRVQVNETHWLYATWKERQFTVSFEPNGGSPCGSITVSYDRKYGFHSPLPVPVRAGYTFTGWHVSNIGGNGDGTQVTDETRVQLLSDQTLYAGWTQDAVEVKVRFEPRTEGQVGLSAEESRMLGFGSTIGVLAEGAAERTVTYPGTYGNYMLAWCSCTAEAHKGLPEYGGRHYSTDYSSSYEKLPAAVRVGYTFTGWTYRGEAVTDRTGTLAAFGHTLFASYTPNTYVVALDGRGATKQGQASVTMTFDAAVPRVEVPEKRGYTFLGYYTGTKGSGTQYYGADGNGMREWLEDSIGITKLYACWEQDKITVPEEGDRTEPEEKPEISVEGSISRNDGKLLVYADDYDPSTGALNDLQPYLTYDTPATEGAIPGTEEVAVRARMGAWMLDYQFRQVSGTDYVRVYVTVPYRTQYERIDETLVISGQQKKTYSCLVPKAWSYWEVVKSGMYYPKSVTLENGALEEKSITLDVMDGGAFPALVPDYVVRNYGRKENHVFWQEYDADGMAVLRIELTEEEYIISDVLGELPDIDAHLGIVCANAAWEDGRQASVKSDRYELGGEVMLSDSLNQNGSGSALDEGKLPSGADRIGLTSYEQTYQSGVALDEEVPNGMYASSAFVIYEGDASNIGMPMTKEVMLTDVNGLRIHTPVACSGVAEDGIEGGVLTLSSPLNFFTLWIDNSGTHMAKLGYGHKDFRTALSGRINIAMEGGVCLNQVRFPFDVYVDMGEPTLREDGTYHAEGDCFVPAGTWLTVGSQRKTFYVPLTQEDGAYTIQFRTIAANCPKEGDTFLIQGRTQEGANINPECYVALDSMEIRLKLHVEDFSIINTDDPAAKEALDGGSQALILKKGYKFAYRLLTFGSFFSESANVQITPSYYYVSTDGKERGEADLYYNGNVAGKRQNFIPAGSVEDASNIHKVKNNSPFLGIPDALLQKTEEIEGISGFIGTSVDLHTFGSVSLNRYLRMFRGLDTAGLPVNWCRACHVAYQEGESSICEHRLEGLPLLAKAAKAVQEWYGEFYVPAESYVIPKDTMEGYCSICNAVWYVSGGKEEGACGHRLTGMKPFNFLEYASLNTISGSEEFFKKEGYLAVSFRIRAEGDSGESYAFEDWESTELYRGFKGKPLFKEGDVVWYDLSKSAGDDYEVGGVE